MPVDSVVNYNNDSLRWSSIDRQDPRGSHILLNFSTMERSHSKKLKGYANLHGWNTCIDNQPFPHLICLIQVSGGAKRRVRSVPCGGIR